VVTEQEATSEDKDIDVDEADYIPADSATGRTSGIVPIAQREIILKEIAAFRERSNRRDRNKTWYEEDDKTQIAQEQSPLPSDNRRREKSQDRGDKKTARTSAQEVVPSGPAADRRRPREYVKFRAGSDRYDRDEDEDLPDDELERRRLERKRRDLELAFIDVCPLYLQLINSQKERKWLSREKMRTSALEREISRSKNDDRPLDRESVLARLAKWDDDVEAERQVEEYYRDRQLWARKRVEFRRKERERDERDREAETRELSKDKSRAAALADSFLEQQVFEINSKVNPEVVSGLAQPLRLRMTRENVKATPASPAKRTVDEVEGLLEEDDEEESYKPSTKRRMLIPLEYDGNEPFDNDASKENKLRAVVSAIPTTTEGLWKYPVQWEALDKVQFA
jgi:RNA-binding protein 25